MIQNEILLAKVLNFTGLLGLIISIVDNFRISI